MGKKPSILIADDHAIIRDGLSAIFRYHKEFSVVGLVEDGQQAVRTAALTHPSIVLMDLEMPTMDDLKKKVVYQLGICAEAAGDLQKAYQYYKDVYSSDVGFEDLSERMLAVSQALKESNR